MKPRDLILAVSLAIVLALVIYRMERPERRPAAGPHPVERQLAPRFELYDQAGQLAKLERYLGRTRIVLVFFDAETGADADPLLRQLVEHDSTLESAGFQVVAVSTATRYANEQAAERLGQKFPFPVLTDIDPTQPVLAPAHRMWGLFDPGTEAIRAGLFLVDRDGSVRFENGHPRPVSNPQATVEELINGSWPADG